MTAFLLIALAAAGIGALVGRWAILVPVAAAWPVYLLGLEQGWWGNGVGDGWVASLLAGLVLAAIGAWLGVLARHRARRLT